MNQSDFVGILRAQAVDAAVVDALAILEDPPGRQPDPQLVELAVWFDRLETEHRALLRRVLERAAHHAVFGVLAILDGARQSEGLGPKGHYELRHVEAGGHVEVLLSAETAPLHELL